MGQFRDRLIAQHDAAFDNWVRKREQELGREMSAKEREAARTFMANPERFNVSVARPWMLRVIGMLEDVSRYFNIMN